MLENKGVDCKVAIITVDYKHDCFIDCNNYCNILALEKLALSYRGFGNSVCDVSDFYTWSHFSTLPVLIHIFTCKNGCWEHDIDENLLISMVYGLRCESQ